MGIKRILLGISFSLLIGVFAISCGTKSEYSDADPRRTVNNIGQRAIVDTTNMEEIQGVPIIQAPGAQIDRDKLTAMLDEANVSYRKITNPKANAESIQQNIVQLKTLFERKSVRNDRELEFFVHNMLGSTYLRLFKKTGKGQYLDQAEKHIDAALSMFNNKPEYKADLVDVYTGRLAIYSLRGQQEEVLSLLKKLIEDYQNIGYGLYKNWFACRQVEKMYHMIRMDSLNAQQGQEVVEYLTKVSEKYENEVGIIAQMVLAMDHAKNGKQEQVRTLVQEIEERLKSLDNQIFKEEKWKRYRTQIKSIQKRAEQVFDKTDGDTLFYEISMDIINKARIAKTQGQENEYSVYVQLKQDYHSDFAQKTTDNIGNFLAIVHNDKVISSSFPKIQTGISSGRFSLGPYQKEEEAERIISRITK